MCLFRSVQMGVLSVVVSIPWKFFTTYITLQGRKATLPFTAYRYSIFPKPTQSYCQVPQLIAKNRTEFTNTSNESSGTSSKNFVQIDENCPQLPTVRKTENLKQPRTTSTFLHVTNPTAGWGGNVLLASQVWNSESVASSSPTWPLSLSDYVEESTVQRSQLPPHSGWPAVATRLQGTASCLRRLESQKLGSLKKNTQKTLIETLERARTTHLV